MWKQVSTGGGAEEESVMIEVEREIVYEVLTTRALFPKPGPMGTRL